MEELTRNVQDSNLRLTLAFGIGLHHAGLVQKDRELVEELFVNAKIQVSSKSKFSVTLFYKTIATTTEKLLALPPWVL